MRGDNGTENVNMAAIQLFFRRESANAFAGDKSHNRTERDSQGVGQDILISKKLFLELCGP